LAFTSPNGVAAFAALTPELRALPVFAVGDAPAAAARGPGAALARPAASAVPGPARPIAAPPRHALAGGPAARQPAAALPPPPPIAGLILAAGAREPAGDLPALLPDHAVQRLPVYAAEETDSAVPADFDAVLLHSPRAARALAAILTPDAAQNRLAVCISAA